jgi:hypothetical protein
MRQRARSCSTPEPAVAAPISFFALRLAAPALAELLRRHRGLIAEEPRERRVDEIGKAP